MQKPQVTRRLCWLITPRLGLLVGARRPSVISHHSSPQSNSLTVWERSRPRPRPRSGVVPSHPIYTSFTSHGGGGSVRQKTGGWDFSLLSMSGSRYSGIAVAAANRRALERQEQESNARASRSAGCLGRPLTPKENALLAQLRAQLVPPTRGSSESAAGGRRGTSSEEVKTYDVGPGEDEGDGGTCGTEGGKEPPGGRAPVPEEKRYMSKAARKKVKKRFEQQRNGAGASVAGRAAKGFMHDDADRQAKRVPVGSGGGVKRRKKRKQTEEGPSVSGPPVEAGGNRKKKPKVDEGAVTKKTSRQEAAWPPMTKR